MALWSKLAGPVAIALVVSNCGGGGAALEGGTTSGDDRGSATGDMAAVPLPNLSRADAAVRARIEQKYAALTTTPAQGDAVPGQRRLANWARS